MANILSKPSYQHKKNFNGFPLTHHLSFSSTVGELLPVFYDLAKPGDKYSLGCRLLTRTMPLQKPAWMHVTEKIDFFFVPITQIYQFFGEFYYGINDLKTSLVSADSSLRPSFPALDVNTSDRSLFNSSLVNDVDSYFPQLYGTKCRLAELLGFPVPSSVSQSSSSYPFSPSALFPAVYQKIYFDYYRDSDREANDPSYYNLDRYALRENSLTGSDFSRLFTLRYHRWRPDFFTHTYISPLFIDNGAVDSRGFSYDNGISMLGALQSWLLSSTSTGELSNKAIGPNSDPETESQFASAISGSLPTTIGTSSASMLSALRAATSPTSIRRSFALEKLLEITRRAGKHYDAQTLAHFGVEVPTGIAGEVMFLGSQSSEIEVRDVISTAETSEATLGQQAGKGFNELNGKDIKFTAPCDGVIMAIYSAVPEATYGSYGLDRLHTYIERSSWFSPEYDDCGMMPLFRYQVNTSFTDTSSNDDRLGYTYPYLEQKLKFNRACGSLRRTFRAWLPQRDDMDIDLRSFLVSPFYLNGTMEVDYQFDMRQTLGETPDLDTSYGRDPFQHDIYWNVYKSSDMSAYGLPTL